MNIYLQYNSEGLEILNSSEFEHTGLYKFTCLVTDVNDPTFSKLYDIIDYVQTKTKYKEILTIPFSDLKAEDTLYKLKFELNDLSLDMYYVDFRQTETKITELADKIEAILDTNSGISRLKYSSTASESAAIACTMTLAIFGAMKIDISKGNFDLANNKLKKINNILVWNNNIT